MADINDKILNSLKALSDGQARLEDRQTRLEDGQTRIEKTQKEQGSAIFHISTVIKTLPTKQDLETTVEAAKTELKADILGLGVKLIGHRQRIETLEDKTGISRKN